MSKIIITLLCGLHPLDGKVDTYRLWRLLGCRSRLAAVPVGELTYPVAELLHMAAARGVVCYSLNQGNVPTHVRADAWIPNWHAIKV